MTSSKLHLHRLFLEKSLLLGGLAILSIGLSGCSLSEPTERPGQAISSGGTFFVESISGQSEVVEVHPGFKTPVAKRYNFKVCLRDHAHRRAIENHPFNVYNEEGTRIAEEVTDRTGCLNWPEDMSYNFLNDSQYVTLSRRIEARGQHRGSVPFEIAVNPWLHGSAQLPEVLDPSRVQVVRKVETQQTMDELSGFDTRKGGFIERPLWVEEVRLNIEEQSMTQEGVILSTEIRFDPKVRVFDTNNQSQLLRFLDGSFRIRAQFISVMNEGGKEVRRIIGDSGALEEFEMMNQSLIANFPIKVPKLPKRGQIQLALQIFPKEGPIGLQPFEGVFLIGEYNRFKGNFFSRLSAVSQRPDFALSNYITDPIFYLTGETPSAFLKAAYQIEPLQLRFTSYGRETATEREVKFQAVACIRNAIDGSQVQSHDFTITKIARNEEGEREQVIRRSMPNGCVSWSDSLIHRYFIREQLLVDYVIISNEDLGLNERVYLALNPWDFGFTFGRDRRLIEDQDLNDPIRLTKPRSEFFLNGYSYNTLGFRYEMDEFLNLRLKKEVILYLEPRVLRYHSITMGRGGNERLREGVYLLRVALRRNRFEDPERAGDYITSIEKLVQVRNNEVITPIEFSFDDVRLLGSRNDILIELASVDERRVRVMGEDQIEPLPGFTIEDVVNSCPDEEGERCSGLLPKTFIGPIVFLDEGGGNNVIPTETANFLNSLLEPMRDQDLARRARASLRARTEPDFGLAPTGAEETATEVIVRGQLEKAMQRQDLEAFASMENFLDLNHLHYLDIHDEDATREFRRALADPRYVHLRRNDYFTSRGIEPAEIDSQLLHDLVETAELSTELAEALCAFWFEDFFPKILPERDLLSYFDQGRIQNACRIQSRQDPTAFYHFERRKRVFDVGPTHYVRGFSLAYSGNAGFSVDRGYTYALNRAYTWAVNSGLSFDLLRFWSLGTQVAHSVSSGQSWSEGSGNSVSVTQNAKLEVQRNELQVRINKHEKCLVLRLNPDLFRGPEAPFFNLWRGGLTDAEKSLAVLSGLYMCTNRVEDKPVDVREEFFFVAQDLDGEYFQDRTDIRNRQFLLQMRGISDYYRFVDFIQDSVDRPRQAQVGAARGDESTRVFLRSIRNNLPSFPGTYTRHDWVPSIDVPLHEIPTGRYRPEN